MLRIGDFSQLGQVSVRTLRLYDELGLLKPAQIDRFTDYRYYAVEQLPRLNRILALKDLGLSLEQIKRLIDSDLSAEQLRGMLTMKQADLEQEIEAGMSRLARVQARLKQIEQEGKPSPYEVIIKKAVVQSIASLRQIVPTMDQMTPIRCALYHRLYESLKRSHIEPGQPELAIYHMTEYADENIDMEAAVTVAPSAKSKEKITLRQLPAASMLASVVHHGAFYDVVNAIVALYGWIGENGLTTVGPYREIHLFGSELQIKDVNSVTLEIQVPVEPM